MAKKKTEKQTFDEYYSLLYGQRWEDLKKAFLNASNPISLSDSLAQPYYLDSASITAAGFLPVKEGDSVLDMCAAPGGKSLVLALKLKGTGLLVSNDRSADRRGRLHNVIDNCLPENWRKNIKVTGHDSTKWSLYEKETYDCVLLDAPCSSERHVANDSKALAMWGPNRPKTLAIQQFAMLAAALDAVKINGYVLYSTCSVNPLENQQNIEKLHTKRSGRFEEVQLDTNAEKLEHGYIILPDINNGQGPLYFCLLRRIY